MLWFIELCGGSEPKEPAVCVSVCAKAVCGKVAGREWGYSEPTMLMTGVCAGECVCVYWLRSSVRGYLCVCILEDTSTDRKTWLPSQQFSSYLLNSSSWFYFSLLLRLAFISPLFALSLSLSIFLFPPRTQFLFTVLRLHSVCLPLSLQCDCSLNLLQEQFQVTAEKVSHYKLTIQ